MEQTQKYMTRNDIIFYLQDLGLDPVNIKGCTDMMVELLEMSSTEFNELPKKQIDWYSEMYSYIYDFKITKIHNKINSKLDIFEKDISSYTQNKRCIKHFGNTFKQSWMSNTDDEKKIIVSRFENTFPNNKVNENTTNRKCKSYSQNKLDDIKKRNENNLKKFE